LGLATGSLRHHPRFPSRFVEPRHVDVWLPPGYAQGVQERFPVLYMHDGQNIFDPKLSFSGVAWGVDRAMVRLARAKTTRKAIVVAIWNTPRRLSEYMPKKAVVGEQAGPMPGSVILERQDILSDDYLRFLVTELKPFIDENYRTLRGRDDTFIMGSSMGGLISAYAISEYPGIFGGAGCVSTHWPAGGGSVIAYLGKNLPAPGTHRIYFDFGTGTLDAQYEPYQKKVDRLMRASGYKEGQNWLTKKFPGAEHSEKAWSARVSIPLTFLLNK
jgi:predicted alpha/beta superfamily hydrolase